MVTGRPPPAWPSSWSTHAKVSLNKPVAIPFIASLLQIQHVILAVNKMDLVDWEEVFEQIVKDYENFSSRLDIPR